MGWEHNEKVFPLCTPSILNGALAMGQGLVYLSQRLRKLIVAPLILLLKTLLYKLCAPCLSLLFFASIPGKGNKPN
jgi:hypothetical protein